MTVKIDECSDFSFPENSRKQTSYRGSFICMKNCEDKFLSVTNRQKRKEMKVVLNSGQFYK